ncbi:hypothetical protein PV04_06591 [Phialophora macrospora]|uniref:Uncharacterized protein n=1 Tax=Phialophora macrospora TaxID=1851006 RepID=A0A0D2FGY4_9EURO|nr:hypothetical protein PV04_06591 [Phialophora macrospora]
MVIDTPAAFQFANWHLSRIDRRAKTPTEIEVKSYYCHQSLTLTGTAALYIRKVRAAAETRRAVDMSGKRPLYRSHSILCSFFMFVRTNMQPQEQSSAKKRSSGAEPLGAEDIQKLRSLTYMTRPWVTFCYCGHCLVSLTTGNQSRSHPCQLRPSVPSAQTKINRHSVRRAS